MRKVDRLGRPGADQAKGCVSCLGCMAYPEVRRTPGSRRWNEKAYWSAQCVSCNGQIFTAYTRDEVVAVWNAENERLRII
jgi:hypothetical protein